jgi:ADP-ribosylglycohydrolase
MALSLVEHLRHYGEIRQDELVHRFAERMEPSRGYGIGAYEVLMAVRHGTPWRTAAASGFGGLGSFGNGAAMRVAPLGAYFADDLPRVVSEARKSALVTHAHPEGVAGAIAVAVAAAEAWQRSGAPLGAAWLERILENVPPGYTHNGIRTALTLPADTDIVTVASTLGNGSGVTSPDTVPLCLWVAAHTTQLVEALWKTVSALGDRDTTCAIVGGILAVHAAKEALPSSWLDHCETLPETTAASRL